ncbi:exonuclease 1 [Mangifera indica]|uniref:exonuclease 1 n=1 Tax=Mangifera indica TaxID=29780 RepID=UPI001CFB4802|nr:exonuclease 1 [Mangifera indica]
MGIQGLLPLLKSIMLPIHIKELEGCCVAVDTYSWLHKGALSCSRELCKGLPTFRHIEYCMHRVNLLRHYGVKPILVFDGGHLPMKIEQENKRARARKENLTRAIECESDGNSSAAYEFYQKAVDISPSIAHELIQVLKKENVCYVVAPYEADAQMTFLAISRQVDAIITEDSDLIAFGCPRIIFKMDKYGQGVQFQYSMLQKNKDLSFAGFTKQMVLEMCILSGCDYLQSLPGMGLKRAHALISKFKSYEKVIKHLKYSTVSVPPSHEESFKKALLTFQHQRVYDPITDNIVHLSDISGSNDDDLDFLGPLIPQHIAKGIAQGDLDPFTQMPFQVASDSSQLVLDKSSHHKNFRPKSERKKLDLPVQKNLLTKYFCFASLEAKRKFRAPRMSPVVPNSEGSSSLSPEEHVTVEGDSYEINCSMPSPVNSENDKNGFASEVPGSESVRHDVVVKRSPEHTLLPQSDISIRKPSLPLQKELESKDFTDAVEGKTRMEGRKVIIRSSYFQHKQVIKNDQENEPEKLLVEVDGAIDISENVNLGFTSEDSCPQGTTVKRKTLLNDSVQKENVRAKHMRASTSLPTDGCCDPSFNKRSMETRTDEGKFGSDISHLGHYSEIAEKSMEKFVSVVSSFRCSSSGSRASGLRAPLKDLQNTCTKRSSTALDLGQFAFVPNSRKSALPSRRF